MTFVHALVLTKLDYCKAGNSLNRRPPITGRPADTRKMKSAGRHRNIRPSAGLVNLELTEPADRCPPDATIFRTHIADRFYNLNVINFNSNVLCIEGFNMLAQVTYIPKFIMAESEDEFMPIVITGTQKICRAVSNIFDVAGRRRAGIGSTHDAQPMPRFLEFT